MSRAPAHTRRPTARRVLALTSATLALVVSGGGLAHADNIQDTIADTGAGVVLEAGSSTGGTAGIRVIGNNADGSTTDAGCNWDAGEAPLRLQVHAPTGVTATPNPVELTECGSDGEVTVTFTASASATSGTATVSILSTPAGGGGYSNQVSIPITVNRTNTPPTVEVTGVSDGATYRTSTTPEPGCSVVDAEDSDESASPSVTNGAYDDLGSHTVTCSYTDGGDLTRTASATYTVVRDLDTSAPTVTPVLDPATPTGANGWYTGGVSLTWTVTEPQSPETLTTDGCDPVAVSSDQDATTYTCSATSEGGGPTQQSVTLKRDSQAPNAPVASLSPAPNGAHWNNTDVVVHFEPAGDHGPSGIDECSADVLVDTDTGSQVVTGTCTDEAGNESAPTSVTVRRDTQAPDAPVASLSAPANADGWHRGDVTVSFADAGDHGPSGVAGCTPAVDVTQEGADQAVTGTCTDRAGNVSQSATVTVSLDKTAPSVGFDGGPAGGASYYFGSVPTAPTCVASDGLSGLAGACSVDGYSTAVGPHTVTATATDRAGNTTTVTRTYTVLAWDAKGFYQPVDMNGTYNTVKGGSTVPLKFELFAGQTELTDVAAVTSFTAQKITCSGDAVADAIEVTTTGGTSLRYDTTGGQFIQNWRTPTGAGTCYRTTMTAQDGTAVSALFKIK